MRGERPNRRRLEERRRGRQAPKHAAERMRARELEAKVAEQRAQRRRRAAMQREKFVGGHERKDRRLCRLRVAAHFAQSEHRRVDHRVGRCRRRRVALGGGGSLRRLGFRRQRRVEQRNESEEPAALD